MVDTKSAASENRPRRRLLFSLLIVAVITALAVMTTLKPNASEYRRYIGPALSDGSRVTFLYPANVNQAIGSFNTPLINPTIVQEVQMVEPLRLPQAVLRQLPSWQRAHPTNDLTIGALVRKLPARVPVVSGRYVATKRVQQTFNSQGDIYVVAVTVTNAKTRTECDFNYSYLASSAPSAAFAKREAVITNSFQVLPPGAAVPTP